LLVEASCEAELAIEPVESFLRPSLWDFEIDGNSEVTALNAPFTMCNLQARKDELLGGGAACRCNKISPLTEPLTI
jgi:hypothetical protein